ncbi:penicillin-binding protein activator LpoB [Pseudomonas sp. Leaf48]|uniref:SPOR domain-containing protein n=1 Tax=unclassified Pseudomonas TaxID=196821 RepID=UPI0007299210|nr:SPOR domain-containing protein [Pseudomonas sp. Leaf48]KQN54612.1 penicillin-binding protein activator LpoB [Pseudomonas sp. Leaf48]MBV7478172.1 SPOR domain-containing protein [Pseudomonas sp. PDM31]
MRKMFWVIAILALAGCGEGKSVDTPKPRPPVEPATAQVSGPQWDLEVRGETPQAVSDLSGWLIEHSFMSSVVKENGQTRILMGPYNSRAEAQAKQDEVRASLTRAKKQNIELLVLERPAVQ